MKNLLENFKRSNFSFLNMEEDDDISLVETKDDGVSIIPKAGTDFFCDPANGTVKNNAIFMFIEAKGDFIARTRVDHSFINTYDAAAIMVREDDENWAKLCFEKTDFGTRALVSVVTKNGVSDDANGANYNWDSVWLQIARKGNTFATHYSPDGISWHMTRYFKLGNKDTLQLGIVAQSPLGQGDAAMNFYNFEFKEFTVLNLREGH